ncbi:MAG: CoA transferase, partial [Nocardiopsaceae bacterium]|nr:CoA transferase [Nocardiopsaceae bacterium]
MAAGDRGPLDGVRVTELAGIGPGPFAGMLLADLGADVVTVERPDGPSLAMPGNVPVTSRGKRSVVVDLKDPRGVEVVLRLAERSDALLEGYRPGVAERLGVGPAQAQARNPRLVYGRMTGWGQEGPLASAAGHDIGYLAVTGALHAIGQAGGPPQIPVNYLGDYGGGAMFLALGVVSAVLAARATGRGQVVDAAIVDGASVLQAATWGYLAGGAWTDRRGANFLDGGAPYYSVYPTADGRHMAVGALEPKFYATLVELLFAPEGAPADLPGQHDTDRWGELRSALAARFATRTQAEWTAVFSGSDACVAPVLPMREAPAHPHLAARGTYVEVDGVTQPAPAPRFGSAASPGAPASAPAALRAGRIP